MCGYRVHAAPLRRHDFSPTAHVTSIQHSEQSIKNKAAAWLHCLTGSVNETCPPQTTQTSELNPNTFCTFLWVQPHSLSTTLQLKVAWNTLGLICGCKIPCWRFSMQLLKYPLKTYTGRKKEDPNHTSNTIIDDVMTTQGEMSNPSLLTRIPQPLKAKPHVKGVAFSLT